jgi:hypothetical protein
MNRIIPIVAILVLVFALLASPAAATSGSMLDVERRGACTDTSHWEWDLETHHSRIEIDYGVDSHSSGDVWQVVLRHDGDVFFRASRTTDNEGEFDIDRRVHNREGTDHFKASATTGGETCRGTAAI